jgi:hypothetical protein
VKVGGEASHQQELWRMFIGLVADDSGRVVTQRDVVWCEKRARIFCKCIRTIEYLDLMRFLAARSLRRVLYICTRTLHGTPQVK